MYRVPDDRFLYKQENNGNALTIRGKRVWENEKKKYMFIILLYVNGSCCGNCARNRKERVDPLQPAIAEKYCGFMYWQTVMPRTTRM